MSSLVAVLLAITLSPLGPTAAATPVDRGRNLSARPPLYVHLRGGYLLDSADAGVEQGWEHDTMSSYVFSLGAFATIPPTWRQIYFFFGPELSYMRSEESISGLNESYLSSTFTQAFLTSGVTFRPDHFGGDWTFSFWTAFEIWGEQETELGTPQYKRSLGKTQTRLRDSLILPFLRNTVVAVNACYDLSWEWAACLNLESRGPTAITAGMNYGF